MVLWCFQSVFCARVLIVFFAGYSGFGRGVDSGYID